MSSADDLAWLPGTLRDATTGSRTVTVNADGSINANVTVATSVVSTSLAHSQVTVATAATTLAAASSTRKFLEIQNHHTVAVFIGTAGVTTTTGYRLNSTGNVGSVWRMDESLTTAAIHGIVAAATATAIVSTVSW